MFKKKLRQVIGKWHKKREKNESEKKLRKGQKCICENIQ